MTEHVKINDVAPRIQHLGNGGAATFSFPFPIFKETELDIWLDGSRVTQGFTVAGAGNAAGGTVTFATPPTAGCRVTLMRRLALERQSDFQADGLIRAKVLNDELDYQTAALQQVAEMAGRSVRRAAMSSSTADLTLPEPQANRTLKWSADGLALANSAMDVDALGAQAEAALTASQQALAAAVAASTTATAKAAEATAAAAGAQGAYGGIRVTAADTTAGPLASKLVAGPGVSLIVGNAGGNEILTVSMTAGGALAYGGTVTTAVIGGQTYRIHAFRSSGTLVVERGGAVQVLIVAGGGGGGGYGGGGGGGGGVISTAMSLAAGSYTATVGAGGTVGTNGSNSVFNGQTALGGGHGGIGGGASLWGAATSGGSGGGGSDTTYTAGGAGTAGQGNVGGSRHPTGGGGGGGGGAGAVGANGTQTAGGAGGSGLQSAITGTNTFYAGGGGGSGGDTTFGVGGAGGGGDGGAGNVSGFCTTASKNGAANTGGGGGGAANVVGSNAQNNGASGGSGIIIVAYAV